MSARNIFVDQGDWPHDAPNHVFLGRAIFALGRRLLGSDWSDYDVSTSLPSLPTRRDRSDRKISEAQKAVLRLQLAGHTDLPEMRQGFAGVPPRILLSEAQWKAADDLFDIEVDQRLEHLRPSYDKAAAALQRFAKVKEFVRESCAWGRLNCFAQAHDGSFRCMAPELWNTQRSEEWLSSGKISSRDAFGSSRIELDGPSYWLFFDRAGLGILTATANPSSQPLYHQSKYLIFLLFAAERLNVQPNDPRTAKSLANEIEAMAEGFEVVKITRNMAENMATILREPEAGLGKNSPQMRSKKNER